MSQVIRRLSIAALGCALVAVTSAGCSKKHGASFDADSGHPADFFSRHGAAYTEDSSSCEECHGSDLLGGISTVSCSSASIDGQNCHGSGPGTGHGAGWKAKNQHGATAKKAPGASSGFSYCEGCHGSGLDGGSAKQSCLVNSGCHGWSAPHAKSGWDGGGSGHQSTDTGNASVCAQCHQQSSGTPGCYNSTLCHGEKGGHSSGWEAGSRHGAAAKQAPGSSSGFSYCEGCHGSGLDGGSANQSCLVNSGCHGWSAPHAKSGWDGGASSHRTTNEGNAAVCGQCHQKSSGTPGCFNSTLCHGASSGHSPGWEAGDQHGATAKAAPGSSSGFSYCEGCHGSGLDGGSAGQSCLVNSGCHGWSAPHASNGWNGGGSSHRRTDVGNASVCAQCHPVAAPSSGTICTHNGSCHEDD